MSYHKGPGVSYQLSGVSYPELCKYGVIHKWHRNLRRHLDAVIPPYTVFLTIYAVIYVFYRNIRTVLQSVMTASTVTCTSLVISAFRCVRSALRCGSAGAMLDVPLLPSPWWALGAATVRLSAKRRLECGRAQEARVGRGWVINIPRVTKPPAAVLRSAHPSRHSRTWPF